MEIKGDPIFKLKELQIPICWRIIKNDFVDLEPDNNYPIDQVFYHFDEDILNATYKDFCIDLGFYGGYSGHERGGFFKVMVSKTGLNDMEFLEIFISRQTKEIKDKLNFYFESIPKGRLDAIKGFTYDDHYDFNSFHIYSAIANVDYRLSDVERNKIAKPLKYPRRKED